MLARITVLAVVLACCSSAQARTIRQVVPSSVAFWSSSHGVLGSVIFGPTARSEGQIALTRDGGRTWDIRWRGRAVSKIAVVPHTDEAWAEVSPRRPCSNCGAQLLRSRDGGRTWRRAGKAPSMPSFPTPKVGFAMLRGGLMMKTRDGGRAWQDVGLPCRRGWGGYAWHASVSFVSPSRGWLLCTGQPSAGNQSKAVYRTVNGGERWRRLVNVHFEPGPVRAGGLSRFGYPQGMSFARSGRGLLWEGRGVSYLTTDRGRTWRPISVTRADERTGVSGWFVSNRVAYLLVQDDDFELFRTTSGGQTWRLVRSWARR